MCVDRRILLLIAVAGSGKTRAVAQHHAAQTVARSVMAAPTIALIDEIEEWLKRFDCKVPFSAIHSEQGSRAVNERVAKFFEHQLRKAPAAGGILVCTHTALLDMVPPENASEFDLVVDEAPDVFRVREPPFRRSF